MCTKYKMSQETTHFSLINISALRPSSRLEKRFFDIIYIQMCYTLENIKNNLLYVQKMRIKNVLKDAC